MYQSLNKPRATAAGEGSKWRKYAVWTHRAAHATQGTFIMVPADVEGTFCYIYAYKWLLVCMLMHHCIQYLESKEMGIRTPGTGIIDGSVPPCGC